MSAVARRARAAGRSRGRRGAVSTGLLVVVVLAAATIPLLTETGVVPTTTNVESARLVPEARTFNETVGIGDVSPGFNETTIVVDAGNEVNFQLLNTGAENHTFTVLEKAGAVAPCNTTNTTAQILAFINADGGAWSTFLAPGASANWSHTFNDSGSYEFLSLVSNECQLGFHGVVDVLPPNTAAQQELFVNASDAPLSFDPAAMIAAAGIPIQVQAFGDGHTFVVDGVSNDSSVTPGTTLPSSFTYPAPPTSAAFPISLDLNSQSVAAVSAPVILQPGIYWYVCTVPGHFASGMWGKLYVGIAPTPASQTPSISSVLQYAYLGIAGIVVGGAAFLVLMGMNERAAPVVPGPSRVGDGKPDAHAPP